MRGVSPTNDEPITEPDFSSRSADSAWVRIGY